METIRIQNLKSIVDSGDIELKDMTVVIGKNSSGKSTLLRTFPLLKQSMAKSLSSPILWYGEYVDFGSFKKALTSGVPNEDIAFTFSFKSVKFDLSSLEAAVADIKLTLKINDKFIHEYLIDIPEYGRLTFSLKENRYLVSINETIIEELNFIPSIERSFFPKQQVSMQKSVYSSLFLSLILDDFQFDSNGNVVEIRKDKISGLTFIFDTVARKKYVDSVFEKHENDINKERITKDSFELQCLGDRVSDLLDVLDQLFKGTFENVQYFEPLRSRGDRFYRVQGLNVREVDSNGDNAPMILYRMKSAEKSKFQQWCIDNLDFYYDTDDIGDNNETTSVIVKSEKNNDDFNMTDVGFGYSQIFPIVLSIWNSFFTKDRTRTDKIIVIEQPELHLHPAFQKKIIKVFIKLIELVKRQKRRLKFIIETHSETIINYLGYLVSESKIDAEAINLMICEKTNNESVFKKMIFNKNGTINEWPLGFFSDDE